MPGPFSSGLARVGGGYGSDPISLIRPKRKETDAPPDLMPYWPEQQQIEASRTEFEQKEAAPLWARLLSVPSNILFREGIQRGVKQAAEGWQSDGLLGAVGGAASGLFSGEWDEISHGFGLVAGAQETHFSDIRKAFGQTDVEGGLGNFAVNFLGDLAMDPVMYLSPLGFITKGAKSTKYAGETLANQVGKITDATGNAIRGGLVFRIPILQETGIDVMKSAGDLLSKLPLPYFDRFKSMNVQFAKAMDNTFGFLRTNPVTGPLLQKFGAIGIRDPDIHAAAVKAKNATFEEIGIYHRSLEQQLLRMPETVKQLAYGEKDGQMFLQDLIDTGLYKLDNDGLVADAYKRLPEIIKQRAFRTAWDKDETLRSLWKKAAGGDAREFTYSKSGFADLREVTQIARSGGTGEAESIKAVKDLYGKYDYWLPQKWLDKAGLPARPGLDTPGFQTMAEGLTKEMSGLPGALSPMEIDRGITTTLAQGSGGTGQAAFFAKQAEARMARFNQFWGKVQDGSIPRADLEEFIGIHTDVMRAVRDKEVAEGILNSTHELYLPRVRNKNLKALMDEQQGRALDQFEYGGGFAHNKQRKLTEMTTAEADAFLMEIGTKATGFKGAKESVEAFKEEFATHGANAVMNRLFPLSFVQKKIMKIDEEMGSFFVSNPVLADVFRVQASERRLLQPIFWKNMMKEGSPLLWDEAKMADKQAVMALVESAQAAQKPLFLIHEGGALPKFTEAGSLITDAVGSDLRARVGVQQQRILDELDVHLADQATTYDQRLAHLKGLSKIGNKSDLNWSATTPYAEAALKRNIREKIGHANDLELIQKDVADARQGLRDRWGELKGDKADALDRIDADVEHMKGIARSEQSRLYTMAEKPPDWSEFDRWNAEVSGRVENLKKATEHLAEYRAARASVKLGKPEAEFYDRLNDLNTRLVEKAGQLAKAHAEEMTLRAAVRGTVDNLETARGEVLSGREATVGAQREAARAAGGRLKASISPELMSNETKLWYRFRNEGKLGWNELSPNAQDNMIKAGGTARLVAVDPEVMGAAQNFYKAFTEPDELKGNRLIDALDGIRSWFSTMTVIHPAMLQTRMRDFLGGAWSGAGAGYLTHEWGDALRVSNAVGASSKIGQEAAEASLDAIKYTRDADGAVITGREFMQGGQRMGSLGTGTLRDNLLDNLSETARFAPQGAGKKVMDYALGFFGLKSPKENPVIRMGQKFARWGDDTVRSEIALAAWKKNPGWSIEDAFREANHWSYGTAQPITSFERYVGRRFFPFMGFIKWATERSAEQWMTKPSTLAWIPKVRDNAYKAVGLDPKNVASIMPSFVNDNLGIPVANTAEGPKFYLFGSFLPVGNLIDIANAVSGVFSAKPVEGLRYIAQNMHPALKAAGEVIFNTDFWQGRPIKQYPGETQDFLGVNMDKDLRHVVKTFFRGLAVVDRLNIFNASELKVAVEANRRAGVLGTRAEIPLLERYLTSAFGPVAPAAHLIDVEEELRRQRNRDDAQLSEAKGMMRKQVEEGHTANVDAIQKVLSADLARIESRQATEENYQYTRDTTKKIRLVRNR